MTGLSIVNWIDRAKLAGIADCLAVAVAVSLPWSTSATSILLALWLLALLPTLDFASLRRAAAHPTGGLPVALLVHGAAGAVVGDCDLAIADDLAIAVFGLCVDGRSGKGLSRSERRVPDLRL